MVLRGVVFDFDGTLANTLPIVFEAFRTVLKTHLGREISDDELRRCFGPSEEGILQRFVPNQPAKSLESYLDVYERLHRTHPVVIPGVRQMLDLLSCMGLQMAIVTGKGQRSTQISMRHLALADYFTIVETGNPAGGQKAESICKVLDLWSFTPKQAMYVGDMAEDMRVARATGLIPVGAAWLESTRPEILHDGGAIAVFSDPTALAIWVGSQFQMDRGENTPRPRRQIDGANISPGTSQSDCSTEDRMTDTLNDLIKSIVQGNRELVEANVDHAIDEGIPPNLILNDGLIAAMREVGTLFEKGEYFLPEMLVSARAMQAGLSILKPLLVAGGVKSTGRIIMGTVKGDLHDIGKNLVSMMLEGAGFEVIDLGTDVSPQHFAEAVVEFEPQILGISALLTTTMENMQMTIEALEDISVRDRVRVIIGGAPVTAEFAEQIGADGYAADASRAVSLVKHLLDVSPGG